jgi:hypothetical protein
VPRAIPQFKYGARFEDFNISIKPLCFSDDLKGTYAEGLTYLFMQKELERWDETLCLAIYQRLECLVDGDLLIPNLLPQERERVYPKICEAIYDQVKGQWALPVDGAGLYHLANLEGKGGARSRPDAHTQPVRITDAHTYEAWGPAVPYGDYSLDELSRHLAVKQP